MNFRITAYKPWLFRLVLLTSSPDPLADLKRFPIESLRDIVRYVISCCPNMMNIQIG